MADPIKEPAKTEPKKEEVPMSPEQIRETKEAVLTSLWGADALKAIPKDKKDEKPADKKDEAPKGEMGKLDAGSGDDKDKVRDDHAGAPSADEKPARVVVKKRKDKKEEAEEKPEPAAAPQADLEETVRRVLDEKLPQEVRRDSTATAQREQHDSVLDPQDREVLTTLRALEQTKPEYKGIAARTQDFWKKEEAYQTQWENSRKAAWQQENPGEPFDPDAKANIFDPNSKEHTRWYQRNEPDYKQEDFDATRENVREQRLLERAREEARKERENDPELREFKRERAKAKIEPVIQESVNHATVDLLASVPEFEKEMDDGKGNLILSEATEKKMADANPALFDIAQTESNRLAQTLEELELLHRMPEHHALDLNLVKQVDGLSVRPHADIYDTFRELETKVASSPRDKQMLGNLRFITTAAKQDQINAIFADKTLSPAARKSAVERIEATTWTIQPENVRHFLIVKSKARINAQAEKTRKWFAGRKQDDSKNGETRNGAHVDAAPARSAAPPAGATTSSSDSQDNSKKMTDVNDSQVKEVIRSMW